MHSYLWGRDSASTVAPRVNGEADGRQKRSRGCCENRQPLSQHPPSCPLLGFSQRTLERMRTLGIGPAFRKHGQQVRYLIDELDRWSAEQERHSTPNTPRRIRRQPQTWLRCAYIGTRVQFVSYPQSEVAALAATATTARTPVLVWNATASAPIGLYIRLSEPTPKRGDLVFVRPPAAIAQFASRRGYLPANVPLIKRIAALGGDTICARDDIIFLDGKPLMQRQTSDGHGRPLPHWSGCHTLGRHEVFLAMTRVPIPLTGAISARFPPQTSLAAWCRYGPGDAVHGMRACTPQRPIGYELGVNRSIRWAHTAPSILASDMPTSTGARIGRWQSFIGEASRQFAVPEPWIRAVMRRGKRRPNDA